MLKLMASAAYNTGIVQVRRGSGKIKTRSGQSQEEFERQRDQFAQSGPVIGQLDDLENLSLEPTKLQDLDKIARERLFGRLERLYYERKYTAVLETVKTLRVQMEIPEDLDFTLKKNKPVWYILRRLDSLQQSCQNRL